MDKIYGSIFVSNLLIFNGKYFSLFVENHNFIINLFLWAILLICMTIINFINFMMESMNCCI